MNMKELTQWFMKSRSLDLMDKNRYMNSRELDELFEYMSDDSNKVTECKKNDIEDFA